MAMRIELLELKRIASRSQNINEEMANDLLHMANLLEEICTNVNSSNLTSVNRNLVNAINEVSSRIKNNFPQIINFLNNQVTAYENTNINTEQNIDSLINSLDATFKS